MIKNYIKIAFRNLYKDKTYAVMTVGSKVYHTAIANPVNALRDE